LYARTGQQAFVPPAWILARAQLLPPSLWFLSGPTCHHLLIQQQQARPAQRPTAQQRTAQLVLPATRGDHTKSRSSSPLCKPEDPNPSAAPHRVSSTTRTPSLEVPRPATADHGLQVHCLATTTTTTSSTTPWHCLCLICSIARLPPTTSLLSLSPKRKNQTRKKKIKKERDTVLHPNPPQNTISRGTCNEPHPLPLEPTASKHRRVEPQASLSASPTRPALV
jgi:hypothetical protein